MYKQRLCIAELTSTAAWSTAVSPQTSIDSVPRVLVFIKRIEGTTAPIVCVDAADAPFVLAKASRIDAVPEAPTILVTRLKPPLVDGVRAASLCKLYCSSRGCDREKKIVEMHIRLTERWFWFQAVWLWSKSVRKCKVLCKSWKDVDVAAKSVAMRI